MDLGCISLSDDNNNNNNNKASNSSVESFSSTTKFSKNKSPRGSPPSGGNALNRVTSQIKKPLHRKTSPLNWFPRKKVDSYLKRKIKLLQEAGGMNGTLDETLGHSNPHYCRVDREKRAAREAACKVMEARKAAMVEASWCRILQAARIPNKETDAQLLKAEKEVAEAFEAAKAKGVIMYDTPDRPWKDFEIEISCAKGSTTHTVRASFETAFDVDKQVAAAVKTAFVRLAHCHSFDKDEFKDLLRKISENPDSQELLESDTLSDLNTKSRDDGSNSQKRNRKKQSLPKFEGANLVNMMLERLKCLKEEELASLATIVATCGLNAALANTESSKMADYITASSKDYFMNGAKQKKIEPELPSLDKFLVKKMTKLEKEVHDAKNARKAESDRDVNAKQDDKQSEPVLPSLDKFLVKKMTKLEKEVQDAKNARKAEAERDGNVKRDDKQVEPELPSLDKFLVKKMTKLEKEVHDAKNTRIAESERDVNVKQGKLVSVENVPDLATVLVKHPSKLEKEIDEAKKNQKSEIDGSTGGRGLKYGKTRRPGHEDTEVPSLDKFLVKHVSRLEKEVQEAKYKGNNKFPVISEGDFGQEQNQKENVNSNIATSLQMGKNNGDGDQNVEKMDHNSKELLEVKKRDKAQPQTDSTAGGLDQILVKHKSIFERERTAIASEQPEEGKSFSKSRREARERELLQTWGGIGLGNSMKPHVSRLERDKAAWIKAEEEEKQAAVVGN